MSALRDQQLPDLVQCLPQSQSVPVIFITQWKLFHKPTIKVQAIHTREQRTMWFMSVTTTDIDFCRQLVYREDSKEDVNLIVRFNKWCRQISLHPLNLCRQALAFVLATSRDGFAISVAVACKWCLLASS